MAQAPPARRALAPTPARAATDVRRERDSNCMARRGGQSQAIATARSFRPAALGAQLGTPPFDWRIASIVASTHDLAACSATRHPARPSTCFASRLARLAAQSLGSRSAI